MANNYEFATVEPCIPLSLVGYFDKLLLEAYGFRWGLTDSDGYYFYAKEGIMCDSRELEIDMDIQDFDVNDTDDFEQDILASLEAGDELPSYEAVFQHMIKKSRVANAENPVLTEIVIMAAYTCSKMRMGEFGGWVGRITEGHIQFESSAACCTKCVPKYRYAGKFKERLAPYTRGFLKSTLCRY